MSVRLFSAMTMAALLALCVNAAQAQDWPTKPVRLTVPFPPGTAPDIASRLMAEKLSQGWKQQMVVENRPGAGGIPGMSAFIKTAPDGYSFAVVPATVVTLTPHLFKNPQYSIDTDVTPVAILATGPFIVAVNPGIGVNSLDDLLKMARAQPGKVNFAPPTINTTPHLAGEVLAVLAPAKTPAAMVERMNKDVNAVAQMPDIVSRYAELGIYPRPGTVQQAADFLSAERKLWGKVIKDLNIQA